MRIAQIAPLAESVPPQLYGGTSGSSPTLPRSWWLEVQGRCCGNSMRPPLAAALVAAKYGDMIEEVRYAAE